MIVANSVPCALLDIYHLISSARRKTGEIADVNLPQKETISNEQMKKLFNRGELGPAELQRGVRVV